MSEGTKRGLPSDAERFPYFEYRVVSSNGAGVHSSGHLRLRDAKAAAESISARNQESTVDLGPFEIERREHISNHAYRYKLRRRSRWVTWEPGQDIETRKPDWTYA